MFVTSFSMICTYIYVHVLTSGTDPFLIAAHVPITDYVCSFSKCSDRDHHIWAWDAIWCSIIQRLPIFIFMELFAAVAYIDTIRVLIMQCIAWSNGTCSEQYCVVWAPQLRIKWQARLFFPILLLYNWLCSVQWAIKPWNDCNWCIIDNKLQGEYLKTN